MSVTKKVTLITGAASGIGYATAKRLASEGHALVLFDSSAEKLQEVEADLKAKTEILSFAGSVVDESAVASCVTKAIETFGSITGLVTSAGIVKVKPAFEETVQSFRDHLDVNVTGSWLFAQAVGRHMAENNAGSIVMIGSVYGSGGAPNRTAYCASKGAVHNLVQSLAVEWGPLGIRVNAVAPTGVRTPMVQDLIDRGQYNLAGVKGRTPLGRLAEAEEVAAAIRFLLSDESSMTTGIILPVDGGWLANGYTTSN
jgi:NAD(P)-dependent dehydrogenase (short-subunit alcohol dehydrogenase family)